MPGEFTPHKAVLTEITQNYLNFTVYCPFYILHSFHLIKPFEHTVFSGMREASHYKITIDYFEFLVHNNNAGITGGHSSVPQLEFTKPVKNVSLVDLRDH